MLSPQAKETVCYYANLVALMLVAAGSAAAIAYMGYGFMRRFVG